MDEELNQGDNAGAADAVALEAKARSMGWAPKERWRGDPEEWVDAAEFLKRGETLIPVLRANNRKLEEQTSSLAAQNRDLATQLEELRNSMNEFTEAQREMMRDRLAQQRTEIRKQLREARDSGDDAAIERLEQTLDENAEQAAELKETKPAATSTKAKAPAESSDYIAWKAANPWYGGSSKEDQRKSALAMQFGREAAAQGLKGTAFFEYIDAELEQLRPTPTKKVEGGRPPERGGGGGNDFDALPPEAKAQAKKDAVRFVGPNKVFKTEKEWYAHFAKLYNGA